MFSSSSSNPSSQPQKKYDVFISFRGEDTRFNFTSHLHDALCRNHIETYIDYRLDKGEEVWPSLVKAIEDSSLFLVIFSENYASSTWCLKELSKIFECSKIQPHHLVIPVFYRVDPSHVRKQSRSYQKAFEEHEHKRINKKQLQEWREALTHVANISGWHCSFDRNEAELIKEIVICVIQKLRHKSQSEADLKNLIGIHKRMAEVESLLYNGSNDDVRLIGIWGMGGMGKSTLAKALFNKLCFAYEGFCFLNNVREKSEKYGIVALKKKFILGLLGDKESNVGLLDDTVSSHTMRRLGRKKLFIVLDDVDDPKQIEDLAGRHDWFGPGSKILITSRDKQVMLGKEVDDIYRVEALNHVEAFDLFSINAIRNDYADPKTRELAKKVAQYAEGNPLALKVLGSLLNGKNQEAWESQLGKLQKLPCKRINDILKLSFDGLDCEEKSIFLDIACFFCGYYVEDVKKLLDACGYSTVIGLERLEDKALLETHEGTICMHRLVKEMGRQVVCEESLNDPTRRTRLWNSNEISELLKKNMGSEAIEGITLNLSDVEEVLLSPKAFCSMPNLKFLDFHKNMDDQNGNKLIFPGGIEFLPSKLRLLRWVDYPSKFLPKTFNVENLVEIQMRNSNLTKLWDGNQNLVNLSKIELRGSKYLIELPNFSKAKKLRQVDLAKCSKLRSVHPSILSLNSLCLLFMSDCESLTSLTSNTHLESLRFLDLEGCSRLNKFSVTSNNCRFELTLSGTAINDELCSSSGCLSKMDVLFLEGCKSVTSLHKLVDLCNLRCLHANGCNKLASNLRSIFDVIRTLVDLELEDCSEFFEVPDNISMLSSLRQLELSGSNIETLPSSIKHLSSLQWLSLNGCERLRSLPELPPSIKSLSTVNCLSIEIIHLTLMSEDVGAKEVNDDDATYPFLSFTNCIKLDRQSINAAEAKVLLDINKAIYGSAAMDYPGERVPMWFMFRSTQCLVTVDLHSVPQHWNGGFIFCAVFTKSPPNTCIEATWLIDGEFACRALCLTVTDAFTLSDHVILYYDQHYYGALQCRIEEKKAFGQYNTYHPLLQIQFTVRCLEFAHKGREGVIKECGVCPTFAFEYQNCIKQIKLALHPHSNSITKQEAPSRKRKYHSLLR